MATGGSEDLDATTAANKAAAEATETPLGAAAPAQGSLASVGVRCDQPVDAGSQDAVQRPESAMAEVQTQALRPPSIDLDAWRGDLSRLHVTIDQVVQAFISSQTRQLDTVAAELASHRERIMQKERHFTELSDSIASFVEEEAKRLEVWGVTLGSAEADARHEAYDAELPGPPALHRINRLWRKATRAFEASREANERESAAALEEQRRDFEARVAAAEARCRELEAERREERAALEARLEALRGEGVEKQGTAEAMSHEVQQLSGLLAATRAELAEMAHRLEQMDVTRCRSEYERGAEREELERLRAEAAAEAEELGRSLAISQDREQDLLHKCAERADKLEQMRRLMDEQEREMTMKIDRVQHYVKERQAGALHAEKKQQDAERMAERWQGEVRRLQAEKDKLAMLVLDLEGRQNGQVSEFRGAWEQHQQEVSALQESLRRKEEEMRSANLELMQKRDDEYQAKVFAEKQREKERSIALLKKKEQEVHIKDQQLKAARHRIQELEASTVATVTPVSTQSGSPTSSRGSTASRRPFGGDGMLPPLPPLPLSAR